MQPIEQHIHYHHHHHHYYGDSRPHDAGVRSHDSLYRSYPPPSSTRLPLSLRTDHPSHSTAASNLSCLDDEAMPSASVVQPLNAPASVPHLALCSSSSSQNPRVKESECQSPGSTAACAAADAHRLSPHSPLTSHLPLLSPTPHTNTRSAFVQYTPSSPLFHGGTTTDATTDATNDIDPRRRYHGRPSHVPLSPPPLIVLDDGGQPETETPAVRDTVKCSLSTSQQPLLPPLIPPIVSLTQRTVDWFEKHKHIEFPSRDAIETAVQSFAHQNYFFLNCIFREYPRIGIIRCSRCREVQCTPRSTSPALARQRVRCDCQWYALCGGPVSCMKDCCISIYATLSVFVLNPLFVLCCSLINYCFSSSCNVN